MCIPMFSHPGLKFDIKTTTKPNPPDKQLKLTLL